MTLSIHYSLLEYTKLHFIDKYRLNLTRPLVYITCLLHGRLSKTERVVTTIPSLDPERRRAS